MQEPRRLIVRSEADRGQADAINRGFAQALDADIMGHLNADDILLPGTLSFVTGAFRRYPQIDIVYGIASSSTPTAGKPDVVCYPTTIET